MLSVDLRVTEFKKAHSYSVFFLPIFSSVLQGIKISFDRE